jgi:hypothetical protein
MGTDGNSNAPANVEGVQNQLETVTEQIEKQEEKVEAASTPAEAEKAKERLTSLLDKFDTLVERLDAIDKKLAEPTVPAPEAKLPEVTQVPTPETPVSSQEGAQTPPRKRRMGAW